MLPLTVSAARIARVTEDLSQAKKAATVTWTVEPTTTIKPEPKPDPENGVAFAVYSDDDKSLDFYKRDRKPEVGDTFNGKVVTKVMGVNETTIGSSYNKPFEDVSRSAEKIEVVDSGIKPMLTIGWFSSFSSATSANVIKLDTSADSNMTAMFYGCGSLTDLDLSTWDVSKVEEIGDLGNGSLFQDCSSLTSLDLSGWNTSSVKSLRSMFQNCSSLTSLDLSGWNTSSVSEMIDTFRDCSNLTSLDLSGWDTSNVYAMSFMFSNCSSLTTVGDLSGWNTSSVYEMISMFEDCPKLTADCSNWGVSSVYEHESFNTNAPGVIAPNWDS